MLSSVGISCFIREYHDGNIVTPTLCITDDTDHGRAVALLRQVQTGELSAESDWTCPACGEAVPANFDVCWKCEAGKPG